MSKPEKVSNDNLRKFAGLLIECDRNEKSIFRNKLSARTYFLLRAFEDGNKDLNRHERKEINDELNGLPKNLRAYIRNKWQELNERD